MQRVFSWKPKKRALECQCKVFFQGIFAENCFLWQSVRGNLREEIFVVLPGLGKLECLRARPGRDLSVGPALKVKKHVPLWIVTRPTNDFFCWQTATGNKKKRMPMQGVFQSMSPDK